MRLQQLQSISVLTRSSSSPSSSRLITARCSLSTLLAATSTSPSTTSSSSSTSPPAFTVNEQSNSTATSTTTTHEPTPDLSVLRTQAIKLYKELYRLGKDYPDPAYKFNDRLRRAFEKNAKISDPHALKKQLELGEHIKKEVLALISLKKYRHLRRSYHADEPPRATSV
ncbi:hypothetical protein BCR39DRAFT_544640 [Naematelia encephala]|uniref:Complex 1 LYR protein domain-containing protein n=1 Tax=Naematelia encephala TaxID=71784 RepID=A0A1Y2ART9_9TREE|nr:hypothetical protein BCR39DRAFT_544640 [Naematelia encephala]